MQNYSRPFKTKISKLKSIGQIYLVKIVNDIGILSKETNNVIRFENCLAIKKKLSHKSPANLMLEIYNLRSVGYARLPFG